MYRSTIRPNNLYDEVQVEKIDAYRRVHIAQDGGVKLTIVESKSQSWDSLEDAENHQRRECHIELDKTSIETLIVLLQTMKDEK